MAGGISVENVDRVVAKLQAKSLKGAKKAELEVGYKAEYAIHVHENLEAYHEVGQAKYLEVPYRRMQKELADLIAEEMQRHRSLEEALLKAGYKLLKTSLPFVPVDTGFLRSSGYVEVKEQS